MSTKPKNPIEIRVRELASENRRSIFGRLREQSIEAVTARLALECQNGTDQQFADWLVNFEKAHPVHYIPAPPDFSQMTNAEKHSWANKENVIDLLKPSGERK